LNRDDSARVLRRLGAGARVCVQKTAHRFKRGFVFTRQVIKHSEIVTVGSLKFARAELGRGARGEVALLLPDFLGALRVIRLVMLFKLVEFFLLVVVRFLLMLLRVSKAFRVFSS